MIEPPFIVDIIIDELFNAKTFIDNDCTVYSLIDYKFSIHNKLQCISIRKRQMYAYNNAPHKQVDTVIKLQIDIEEMQQIV
jgi:hypothetical protein